MFPILIQRIMFGKKNKTKKYIFPLLELSDIQLCRTEGVRLACRSLGAGRGRKHDSV